MISAAFAQNPTDDEPRIQAALAELQRLIERAFPMSAFLVGINEDPPGLCLRATVDVEDLDDVLPVFLSRLVSFQVDDGLPVYVVLDQPLERVIACVSTPPVGLAPTDAVAATR